MRLMCTVLAVAPSGYYRLRAAVPTMRAVENSELKRQIIAIYEESERTYGVPQIYRELRKQGVLVNHKRVHRLVRLLGLSPVAPKKYKPQTTDSNHSNPVVSSLRQQDFSIDEVNKVFVTDITYLETGSEFVYLVVFMDLCSRMIKGWHVSNSLHTELVTDALEKLQRVWDVPEGAIYHSVKGASLLASDTESLWSRLEEF